MARKPDFCASCGRQRGDGRRDRKWRYVYADIPRPKLTALVCFCAGCCSLIDEEAALASGAHSVASIVVIGSTASSGVDLAQLALTAEQAIKLGALIVSAGQEALAADRAVEELRKYGPAAARMCFALADADMQDVLVDQSRIRLGYPLAAQQLAERAYGEGRADGDWQRAWREAGERLQKGSV